MINAIKRNIKIKFISTISTYLFLTFILIFALGSVSYYVISQNLQELKTEVSYQLQHLETEILSSIASANQIIYGLSVSLANSGLEDDQNHVYELIENFDPNLNTKKGIDFSALVVVDKNNQSIASSSVPKHAFRSHDFNNSQCLNGTKENPYQLQVGNIRLGKYSEEEILPLGMAFNNKNGDYKGAICTGITLKNLSEKMKISVREDLIVKAVIADKDLPHIINSQKYLDQLFQLSNVIKSQFISSEIIVEKQFTVYPYKIQITLDTWSIIKRFFHGIIGLLCYIIISLFVIYAIFILLRSIYREPLALLSYKTNNLPKKVLFKENEHLLTIPDFNKISISELTDFISNVLDYANESYKKDEMAENQKAVDELRRRMVYLSLIENNYSPYKNVSTIKKGALLNHTLNYLIHQEKHTFALKDFLWSLVDYMKEVFDIEIKCMVDKHDNKEFSFYYVALSETILIMLNFIRHTQGFETDTKLIEGNYNTTEIIGTFEEDDIFPTFTIIAMVSDSKSLRSLGWENNPSFSYMNLYTAYLLARENNLILKIKHKEDKVYFILSPVDQKIAFPD